MPDAIRKGLGRRIIEATAVAGTLDILAATALTLYFGRSVSGMLRYVASGPFPGTTDLGLPGALLGLATHYALMAMMCAAFVLVADRVSAIRISPILSGVVYGLITYVVMNLIVVHLRFGTPLPPKTLSIVTQLFCHVFLVGIPIALVTMPRRSRGGGL